MPNIFDNFLTQAFSGDNIKDYKHASKLFVDNNYERSPKYTWLFHVYFDLNPELTTMDQRQQIEAGMLVKAADLPKFRVDTKVYNNYNRPSIAQSKARFEDINITFHDDTANIVRKLWFDYYNYYYRDMDNNYGDATGSLNEIYKRSNKQVLGQRNLYNRFGYSPRKDSNVPQYIQAIRIYSLHQKRFSEYTLINPVITAYRHGSHVNGQDSTLENTMTISYETVLYASGSAKVARGFADLHYDKSPSPLTPAGGGTNSILGPGGLVNVVDEVISDGGNGKWGSAAFKLVRGYQKNKNINLSNLAQGELVQALTNLSRGGSILDSTYFPYRGAASNPSFQSALATSTTASVGSVNSNGINITAGAPLISGGISSALSGNPLSSAGSNISGLLTNAQGLIAGADLNKVVDLTKGASSLVAATSTTIPTNSFTAGIQAANEQLRSLANADTAKQLQDTASKAQAFFNSQQVQTAVTSFQTGTNNVLTQASSLSLTPFKNFQTPASSAVASESASLNMAPNNIFANYSGGNTSTNPSPSATNGGGYGTFV